LSCKTCPQFMSADTTKPLVGILTGSKADWEVMQHCARQLEELHVPWEAQTISAHRAPDALLEYLSSAVGRGLEILIAAAGDAALLAVSILGLKYPLYRQAYEEFRKKQTARVLADRVLKLPDPPAQRG